MVIAMMAMLMLAGFRGLATEAGASRTYYSPPYPPLPVHPQDGAKDITDTTVTLQWTGQGAYRGETRADHVSITNYLLHVGTSSPQNCNSAYCNVFNANVGTVTSKSIAVERGTTYYWAVRADDIDGSTWSSTWSFTTNSAPVVSIDSVSDPGPVAGFNVTLKGTASDPDGDQITDYHWESSLDGEIGHDAIITTTLSKGEHVISFSAKDEYDTWSECAAIELTVTPMPPPQPPVMIGPTTTHDPRPVIAWSCDSLPEEEPLEYHLSIGTEPGMYDVLKDHVTYDNTYQPPFNLEYEREKDQNGIFLADYYVTMYAATALGTVSQAAIRSFTLVNHRPVIQSVEIIPQEARVDDNIGVLVKAEDKDGDGVELVYSWSLDRYGAFIPQSAYRDMSFLPAKATEFGDYWLLKVEATDGMSSVSYQREIAIGMDQQDIRVMGRTVSEGVGQAGLESLREEGDIYLILDGEYLELEVDMENPGGLEIEWDPGDGTGEYKGSGFAHRYLDPGNYNCTVTVVKRDIKVEKILNIRVLPRVPEVSKIEVSKEWGANHVMAHIGFNARNLGPRAILTVFCSSLPNWNRSYHLFSSAEEWEGINLTVNVPYPYREDVEIRVILSTAYMGNEEYVIYSQDHTLAWEEGGSEGAEKEQKGSDGGSWPGYLILLAAIVVFLLTTRFYSERKKVWKRLGNLFEPDQEGGAEEGLLTGTDQDDCSKEESIYGYSVRRLPPTEREGGNDYGPGNQVRTCQEKESEAYMDPDLGALYQYGEPYREGGHPFGPDDYYSYGAGIHSNGYYGPESGLDRREEQRSDPCEDNIFGMEPGDGGGPDHWIIVE